ncbi:hypothetical protein CVT24_007479 [Panaeolus cyanescens]|uniref:Uncharacterized protein n=1 Tax=Panaeolus cyanescens TaxID=181874 RepID=A0A409YL44_9AGAR|nr:hypothetical protein CVT24_007479 [Panaeolus cyanescens]
MAMVLSTTDMANLRPLEEFNTPEEVLTVLRDITQIHKDRYLSTGELHRSISPTTIFISPEGRGVLPYLEESDFHCLPANPVFASFATLAKSTMQRKNVPDVDYLDDLESLYYTMIYLITTFRGPGEPMSANRRAKTLTHALSVWLNDGPLSAWSVLEKEGKLLCPMGFANEVVQPFFGPQFAYTMLLQSLHTVIHERYMEKMDNFGGRVDDGAEGDEQDNNAEGAEDELSEEELKRQHVRYDYDTFIWAFDCALEMLKDYSVMNASCIIPPSLSHLFTYNHNTEEDKEEQAKGEEGEAKVEEEVAPVTPEANDDGSGEDSSLEPSPVDEQDAEAELIKRGLGCADEVNDLLLNAIN